jgi:hypothetical protein
MHNVKIFFLAALVSCNMCHIQAQQIKLQEIYAGEDLMAGIKSNAQGNMRTLHLPALTNNYVVPALTPRFIKQSCIPHGPFAFTKFEATRQNDASVKLLFETIDEYTSHIFTVQRAFAPGTEHAEITQPADSSFALLMKGSGEALFMQTDSTPAKNKGSHTAGYQLTDKNIFTGITFYRITQTDMDGSDAKTQIIAVIGTPLKETVAVYPNPARASAQVQVFSKYTGAATLQLLSTRGAVIQQIPVNLYTGFNNINLVLQGNASGMYYINVLRAQHVALKGKLVKL